MEKFNFCVDPIVTKLTLPELNIKNPKQLMVEVKLNALSIKKTPSRINIAEFKPKGGTEFKEVPEKLRHAIEESGITLIATYMGNEIGSAKLNLPQTLTELIKENMNDMEVNEELQLKNNGEKIVGTLNFRSKIFIKCEELKDLEKGTCRKLVDKSISPKDIIFLVTEAQKPSNPCDPCLEIAESSESESNTEANRCAQISTSNPVGNSVCKDKNKKIVMECDQIMDAVLGQSGPAKRKMKIGGEFASGRSQTCIGESPLMCEKLHIKPIRFCPVCLNSLSWLPKTSTCTKCGAKPQYESVFLKGDVIPSADQIIDEILGNKPKDSCEDVCKVPSKVEEFPKCRCTCTCDKICTHCRVQQKIAKCLPQKHEMHNIKGGYECKESQSQEYCIIAKPSRPSVPYLSYVFEELSELYGLKKPSPEVVDSPPDNNDRKNRCKQKQNRSSAGQDHGMGKAQKKGQQKTSSHWNSLRKGWSSSNSRQIRKYCIEEI